MIHLKHIIFYCTVFIGSLICLIFFGVGGVSYAQDEGVLSKECFYQRLKVTAYYTPLSGQGVYFNGDYETERAINGGNRYGASGKHVFNGMLAGPKGYPYGTTIKLPEYGIGGVYDRGGAIISTSGYDVIDIRAGSGLDGMIKALYRGSRMITGTVCASGVSQGPLGFDRSSFPGLQDGLKTLLWTLSMQEGNNSLLVSYLQSFLVQLGYLPSSHTLTTLFGPLTTQALCLFQQKTLAISPDDEYCGYYGPKTRKKFSDLVIQGVLFVPTIDSLHTPSSGIQDNKKKQKKKRMVRILQKR